jgi:hypothetical protein
MKKKTLISRLKEDAKLLDLKGPELELAAGGIQTMTNCNGTCSVHMEEDGPPPK